MTTYTEKTIEDAALICATKASAWAAGGSAWGLDEHAARVGASAAATDLARAAFHAASMNDFALQWAEAEAMIRTGWRP